MSRSAVTCFLVVATDRHRVKLRRWSSGDVSPCPAAKARCRCPDGDAPGHSHDRELDDLVDSFKPVDDPNAHRWAISDGPDPADASKGYEARCERCGLRVVAMVRRVGLSLDAQLFVAGYRVNGALHVVAPASREPYSASKHGRCAPR